MNQREMDVLEALYKSDEPMMVTDIVNAKKGLTQSTVTAVLRNLLENRLVEVVGITHSGRVLSRQYRPTEKSRECVLEYFRQECRKVIHIITPDELCEVIRNQSRMENQEV